MGDQGQQRPGVICWHGQLGAHLVAVVGGLVAKRARADEQGDVAAAHPFFPELLSCPLHVAGQRLVHRADLGDALPKAARADDLLLGLGGRREATGCGGEEQGDFQRRGVKVGNCVHVWISIVLYINTVWLYP